MTGSASGSSTPVRIDRSLIPIPRAASTRSRSTSRTPAYAPTRMGGIGEQDHRDEDRDERQAQSGRLRRRRDRQRDRQDHDHDRVGRDGSADVRGVDGDPREATGMADRQADGQADERGREDREGAQDEVLDEAGRDAGRSRPVGGVGEERDELLHRTLRPLRPVARNQGVRARSRRTRSASRTKASTTDRPAPR